jgi:phosphoglycolate phosphatase-like HAD superfamily hydrolase
MLKPDLVALDFDGVVCDGLQEYFETTSLVCQEIWGKANLEPYREAFYRLRPVVETGWEMPMVLRALMLGRSEAEILVDWGDRAAQMLLADGLNAQELGQLLDGMRDRLMAKNLDGWLDSHRFYPGMLDVLANLESFVIISTKESRFIRQLLGREGIKLGPDQVYGKETGRSKGAVLGELLSRYDEIWFVEDRLATLRAVRSQAELANVRLFLADWGYNLASERALADREGFGLLSLDRMGRGLEGWVDG